MNTFKNIPDSELFDLLIKYTDQYTNMMKDDKDLISVRTMLNNIIRELKVRKETPGGSSQVHQ